MISGFLMLLFFRNELLFYREISEKLIYLIIIIPSIYLSFIALHSFIKKGNLNEAKRTDFIDKQLGIFLLFSFVLCFAVLILFEKHF